MVTWIGFLAGGTSGHASAVRLPYLVESVVDFSLITDAQTSTDVIQMIQVPAETWVVQAGIEVTTALSASVTMDFGDDGDPNRWVAAKDNTVGFSALTTTNPEGVIFTTANTIDLTSATAEAVVGVIRCWAIMVDMSGIKTAANVLSPNAV